MMLADNVKFYLTFVQYDEKILGRILGRFNKTFQKNELKLTEKLLSYRLVHYGFKV